MGAPKRSACACLLFAGGVIFGWVGVGWGANRPAGRVPPETAVPGEILVRYKRAKDIGLESLVGRGKTDALIGVSPSVMALHRRFGVAEVRRVLTPVEPNRGHASQTIEKRRSLRARRAPDELRGRGPEYRDYLERTVVVRLDPGTSIDDALRAYRKDPAVERADPHGAMALFYTPTDPSYGAMWGLAKIEAPQAWDIATGADVVVAVVDTGLDRTHPDLAANQWVNDGEIPGNFQDDDQNGFIDDVNGWDFASGDSDPMDGHGHGTHVSGTIAATANNGVGGAGAAFDSRVMVLKGFLDSGWSESAWLADAITYAADNGADVINTSWGGYYDPVVAAAVLYALAEGVVVVAAAGNESMNVSELIPASLPGVIAVAATDSADGIAWFSNFGAKISLAAPGVDILSTVPGPSYESWDGTSMAAPHVAGVAALLLSYWPQYSVTQVRATLIQNADDLGTPGFDPTFGYGRLNAGRVMEAVADRSPPTAPTHLTATPLSSTQIRLRWGAAYDDRGVAGYYITRDGVSVSTVTGLLFDDRARAPDTEYAYSVTTFDLKGKTSAPATQSARTPIANPNEGVVSVVSFPNPAKRGHDPTLRVWMDFMDRLEISIFDVSGGLVHRATLSGEPTGFANGVPYHDYPWTDDKATGAYLMIAVGKRGVTTVRARSRFMVVR